MRQVTLKIFFNKATNLYCGSTDKWSMQSTQQSTHARTHILEIIFQSPKSLILNSHAALTLLSYGLSTMYMFFFCSAGKTNAFWPSLMSCPNHSNASHFKVFLSFISSDSRKKHHCICIVFGGVHFTSWFLLRESNEGKKISSLNVSPAFQILRLRKRLQQCLKLTWK